ncbi:uncharacterized protein B0H18DRAFT_367787 [Fomitopsis serialis]|uniref:uncharacterized protein n=1 Tax=Fomitopsis serialis TaxID=139415 RepID=UPI00200880B4|nr:uncharacterized protein B0H18DRAFT_367787 [Neoantrodia serialis]KAH9925790.1 hypothetical protein B0H18DRAFT_367787 [Neoantrodia serialis]
MDRVQVHGTDKPLAQVLLDNYTINYCQLASAALLLFDYLLTFGDEAHFIWGTRMRVAFVFYLNRFTMLATAVLYILGILSWHSLIVCKGQVIANEICLCLSYLIWTWVSALRIQALSQSIILTPSPPY